MIWREEDPQEEYVVPEDDPDDPEAAAAPDEAEEEEPEQVRQRQNADKARAGQQRRRQELALAAHGLGFDDQDRLTVLNAAAAAQLSGIPPPATGEPAPPAAEEPLGEMPDPTLDNESFLLWLDERDRRRESSLRQHFEAQLGQVQAPVVTGVAREAVASARENLADYGLGSLTEHPDFDRVFTNALRQSGIPIEQWSDPDMQARVAGIVLPDLRKTMPREPRAAERRGPPPTGRAVERAAISRDSYVQTGASRGGGRVPAREPEATEAEQWAAQRMDISVEAYRALGDETGREYAQVKARAARAGRR